MRPIRLEVQGLTSYKEPVSLDFTELDLFAITGPTGSGKSSLVDAITYALYGQVPRVGRSVKDLISQGGERMKVSLEFSADGHRYRVHRSSALKGQSPIQLERFEESVNDWKGIADKATEVTIEVERLLRLDYEAFIRSVLLPQGEFEEFLAGDRDQRRKVLDRLLRLGVYALMQQRANSMAAYERAEAERIRERLEKELADATVEALASARDDLASLEQEAEQLAATRNALEDASRSAEQLSAAMARAEKERRESDNATKALTEARETLSGGEKAIADLEASLTEIREQLEKAAYDPDSHVKLTSALADARQRDEIEARLNGFAADVGKVREDLARLQAAAAESRKNVAEAAAAVKQASDAFEEARHANAAVLLRKATRRGDPCPVCGQPVPDLPPGDQADYERLRKELENARDVEKKAEQAAAAVERDAAVLAERGTKLEQQLAEAKAGHERLSAQLKEMLGSADLPTAEVQARLAEIEDGKQKTEGLTRKQQELSQQREKQARELSAAHTGVARLEADAESHKRECEVAEKEASAARDAIQALAVEHEWEDAIETLSAGGDVALVIRQQLQDVQRREPSVNQGIGACRTRIEQIKENIVLAEDLRSKERAHAEGARLAKDLATVLRADALPAFVRDSAMQALAAGGSTWLRKLSTGRFDLKVDGQDFCVSDLWNAGEERSVQTLSGGETFLASLALALALAEQLPGMSSEGDAGALESLFIDEGFSHLDEETLKVVADALEVLGADRNRLIGVITHVNALAERLPARVVVHKDSTGGPSTITIE